MVLLVSCNLENRFYGHVNMMSILLGWNHDGIRRSFFSGYHGFSNFQDHFSLGLFASWNMPRHPRPVIELVGLPEGEVRKMDVSSCWSRWITTQQGDVSKNPWISKDINGLWCWKIAHIVRGMHIGVGQLMLKLSCCSEAHDMGNWRHRRRSLKFLGVQFWTTLW